MFGRNKTQPVNDVNSERAHILACKEELYMHYARIIEIEKALKHRYGCNVTTRIKQSLRGDGSCFVREPEIEITKTEAF